MESLSWIFFMLCKVLRVSSQLLSWMAHSPCGILKKSTMTTQHTIFQVVLRYQFTAQMWRNWSRKETSTRVRYYIFFYHPTQKQHSHLSVLLPTRYFWAHRDCCWFGHVVVSLVSASGPCNWSGFNGRGGEKRQKENFINTNFYWHSNRMLSARNFYIV